MDIQFFVTPPKEPKKVPAQLLIRPAGGVTLNLPAVEGLDAEAEASATLGYDRESQQWMLAYWPDGATGKPTLREASRKKDGTLRFSVKLAVAALFASLPEAERARTSLTCELTLEPVTDEQHPGCQFFALTLPAFEGEVKRPAPGGAGASAPKPKGSGRGNYARTSRKAPRKALAV